MRRQWRVDRTVAILAAALTAGSGATASAEPPPLDSVVLTAKQAGPGDRASQWTVAARSTAR